MIGGAIGKRGTRVKVYFANPYNGRQSDQRVRERLIRQYFPNALSYDEISHQALRKAQDSINHRLRDKYQTPATIIGKHPKTVFQI